MEKLQAIPARRALLGLTFILNAIGIVSIALSWFGVTRVTLFELAIVVFTVAEGALFAIAWDYHRELAARLSPHKLGEQLNQLRHTKRVLASTIDEVPADEWERRLLAFLNECKRLVIDQRNNRLTAFNEAVESPPNLAWPGDQRATNLAQLEAVDAVLARMLDDLKYD